MSAWKWVLLSIFGGGVAFWIPDLVIPALYRREQGYAVTALCPILLTLFYAAVLRMRRGEHTGPSTAIFAICGIWVLALSFVLLAQKIRGGEGPGLSLQDFRYVLISSFLPWRTALFVTLEGSIVALWMGTAAMLICHVAFERSRWIIPPSVWGLLRHRASQG
jgi:hypothetical protein